MRDTTRFLFGFSCICAKLYFDGCHVYAGGNMLWRLLLLCLCLLFMKPCRGCEKHTAFSLCAVALWLVSASAALSNTLDLLSTYSPQYASLGTKLFAALLIAASCYGIWKGHIKTFGAWCKWAAPLYGLSVCVTLFCVRHPLVRLSVWQGWDGVPFLLLTLSDAAVMYQIIAYDALCGGKNSSKTVKGGMLFGISAAFCVDLALTVSPHTINGAPHGVYVLLCEHGMGAFCLQLDLLSAFIVSAPAICLVRRNTGENIKKALGILLALCSLCAYRLELSAKYVFAAEILLSVLLFFEEKYIRYRQSTDFSCDTAYT